MHRSGGGEMVIGCHLDRSYCMCTDKQFHEKDHRLLVMQGPMVGREEVSVLSVFLPPWGPSSLTPLGGISQGGGCDREGCSV